jgi:hypothetical protein
MLAVTTFSLSIAASALAGAARNATAGVAGFLLQGQGNDVQDAQVPRAHGCAGAAQIAKATLGHGVLVREKPVIRGQAELPGRLQAWLMMAVPKRLASRAGTAVVKKNHAWAPLPERDISSATGTSNSLQD